MTVNERAGKPAEAAALVDVERLVKAYYEEQPDPGDAAQQVAFGTSGHRGSALKGSFNEAHILATTEAICRYRSQQGIDGPLYLGRDTHALSEPAQATALEVLAAHGVQVRVDSGDRPTPTPALSLAILTWNRDRRERLADG
ncbi:MAG TPA: phosphoglucomutase, alpha-D-glucose phosphate-specific, partial [Actinomycetota bacterium]|nr:phosphoglucomutase, alpha-D-glucose phosphate-specific [Actinomycetota bacterium]